MISDKECEDLLSSLVIITFCSLHEKLHQDGLDCGNEVGRLISEFIETTDKRNIRLLYFVKGLSTERDQDTDSSFWLNPVPRIHDTVCAYILFIYMYFQLAYQAVATYMVCTEASVEDLNERLSKLDDKCTISMRNFRPNINISDTLPFDEDRWLHIRIGEAEFACFKPCTRCAMTTIDPDNGKMNKSMQPLKLLRTYRLAPKGKLLDLYKESPVFGVYMAITKEGRIKIGDQVLVRYKPSSF